MADLSTNALNDQLTNSAQAGDFVGVARLLAQGAGQLPIGHDALRWAAYGGHAECVKLLIPAPRPPHKADDPGALSWAVQNNHIECVKLLIPTSAPEINSQILDFAAAAGQIDSLRLLIPVCDPKANHSIALQQAAWRGHAECVTLLVPLSDPSASDFKALRCAIAKGHAECVKILLPLSLIEHQDLARSALSSGNVGVLSVAMAHKPRLLDGIDLATALAASLVKNHFELAALLQSIIEHHDINYHVSSAIAAAHKPSRL